MGTKIFFMALAKIISFSSARTAAKNDLGHSDFLEGGVVLKMISDGDGEQKSTYNFC